MIVYLTFACQWILRDAIDISGSRSIIGADLMVPLFTLVVIHAQIPNIHMLLHILMRYGDYDEQGDVSYNIANLEGSMLFLMQFDLATHDTSIDQKIEQLPIYQTILQQVVLKQQQQQQQEETGMIMPMMMRTSDLLAGGTNGGANGLVTAAPSITPATVYTVLQESVAKDSGSVFTMGNNSNSSTEEDQIAMEELGKAFILSYNTIAM